MKKIRSYISLSITILLSIISSLIVIIEEIKYPKETDVVPNIYAILYISGVILTILSLILSYFFRDKKTSSKKEYIIEYTFMIIGSCLFILFFINDKYNVISAIGFGFMQTSTYSLLSTIIAQREKQRTGVGIIEINREILKSIFPSYNIKSIKKLEKVIKCSSGNHKTIILNNEKILINDDYVEVPERVYFNFNEKYLDDDDIKIIYMCLFTRHYDGHIRQKCIEKLLTEDYETTIIVPYILKISTDYVKEILEVIYRNLKNKDNTYIQSYCNNNLELFVKSYSKMISYWNCYYRDEIKNYKDYIGYKLYCECFGFKVKYIKYLKLKKSSENNK